MILENGIWDQQTADATHQSSPALAAFMAEYFPIDQPVMDFGCGNAYYLHELAKKGYKCSGFEGYPLNNFLHDNVTIIDLTQSICMINDDICMQNESNIDDMIIGGNPYRRGSVISLEVGEHLPKEAQETYMQTVTRHCKDKLIFSWAEIGQPGLGHINCRDQKEVIEDVCARGFKYMEELTMKVRATIEENTSWFQRTLLIFERIKE